MGRDGAFEVVHPSDVLDDGYATIVPDVSPSAKTGLRYKIATGVPDYLEGNRSRHSAWPNNLHGRSSWPTRTSAFSANDRPSIKNQTPKTA